MPPPVFSPPVMLAPSIVCPATADAGRAAQQIHVPRRQRPEPLLVPWDSSTSCLPTWGKCSETPAALAKPMGFAAALAIPRLDLPDYLPANSRWVAADGAKLKVMREVLPVFDNVEADVLECGAIGSWRPWSRGARWILAHYTRVEEFQDDPR